MTQQFGLGRSIGVAQGLQGLQRGQLQNEAMQQQMGFQQEDRAAAQAAAEADARRKQLLQERLQGVMNPETGQLDPAGFTDLLLTDPEVAGTVREQFGLMDEQRNRQTLNKAFGAKQILDQAGTPEEALGMLQQQGYMDDPLFSELADNLQAGDVEGARNELGYGIAAIGGREAYEDAFGTPGAAGGLDIGKFNPRDYTTESFAEFMQTQDPTVLERYADQRSIEIGGVPHRFDPARGGYFPAEVAGGEGQPGQQQTPATPVTTESVAESQGTIAATEEASTQAIQQSQAAFDQLSDIRGAIGTLDEAIELMESDEPPRTGAIMSRLPSVRQAAIKLDNIQNRLGLDVISSVTFGALSEAELNMALQTALPQGLKGEELKGWLKEKKQSQQKLADYLEDAAIFLGKPGNTVADFLEQQQENREATAGDEDVDAFLDQELERLGL